MSTKRTVLVQPSSERVSGRPVREKLRRQRRAAPRRAKCPCFGSNRGPSLGGIGTYRNATRMGLSRRRVALIARWLGYVAPVHS